MLSAPKHILSLCRDCLHVCSATSRVLCRTVKLCEPTLTSYGGLTTCTEYHLSQKPESVVDSVFMHDNYAPSPHGDENSMVVVTKHQVYSLADDDE